MKKNILVLFVLLGVIAEAQTTDTTDYSKYKRGESNTKTATQTMVPSGATFDVGMFVTPGLFSLGYSPLNATKTGLGLGFNGGFDLRIQPDSAYNWWSIGVSIAHYGAKSNYETSIIAKNLQDPIYGYNYELKSDLSNFVEKQSVLTLGLPFGWYYELDDFRLGLGVSLSAVLSANYRLASGKIATSYHDTDLDVWFDSDLGAHGVGVTEYNNEPKKKLDINSIMLSPYLDFSYDMNPFSVGVYLEYDVVNLYRKGEYADKDIVTISDGTMNYNGVLNSNQVTSIHPWTVGVKLRYSLWKDSRKYTVFVKQNDSAPNTTQSPQTQDGSVRPQESISEYDTAVINLIQILRDYKLSEKQIQRALRLYNKMPDSDYKDSKRGAYNALVQYPTVYKEFQKVLKNALNDLKNNSATIVASNCKESLESIPYWKRREDMEYRYEYLENEISKIISIIDSFLDEHSKIKGSQFREQFNQTVDEFIN